MTTKHLPKLTYSQNGCAPSIKEFRQLCFKFPTNPSSSRMMEGRGQKMVCNAISLYIITSIFLSNPQTRNHRIHLVSLLDEHFRSLLVNSTSNDKSSSEGNGCNSRICADASKCSCSRKICCSRRFQERWKQMLNFWFVLAHQEKKKWYEFQVGQHVGFKKIRLSIRITSDFGKKKYQQSPSRHKNNRKILTGTTSAVDSRVVAQVPIVMPILVRTFSIPFFWFVSFCGQLFVLNKQQKKKQITRTWSQTSIIISKRMGNGALLCVRWKKNLLRCLWPQDTIKNQRNNK